MSIKDRLIQFVLRGKDELSPAARKSAEAMEALKQEADSLGKALDDAKGAQGLAKGLAATQRAVAQAETGLRQTEQQVVDLREALNKTPDAAGIQQSLKQAERDAARARKQLNGLQAELKDVEKASAAAGVDTRDLGNEQQRLANEVTKAKAALTANTTEVKALEREQAKASRTTAEHTSKVDAAREGMTSGAKRVLAFAAAYVSLNAAFGLVQRGLNLVGTGIRTMLRTGDDFELLDKRIASLMGSVAGGAQATAWIKKFAKETPLELMDVSEAFALLKSYGLDPMDGSLQSIVDKNEQLGGGMERLRGISSALGQAYAKQKLQTEEILQLVERGVPVWGLLEKVTGKNAAQLQDLATKGRLGRDVIAALIAEIGRSAEGAAADNMGTLTGLVSNLSDVWQDFLGRIAESGALDYAKEQLKGLADYIEEMDKDGRLDKLAESLSSTFKRGAEAVKNLFNRLTEIDFSKLADDSAKWLDQFSNDLDSVTAKIGAAFKPLRTIYSWLRTAADAAFKPLMTGFNALMAIAGVAADVVKGIASDLEQAFTDAGDAAENAGKKTEEQWNKVEQSVIDARKEVEDLATASAAANFKIISVGHALTSIKFAETAAELQLIKVALQEAFDKKVIDQADYEQSLNALASRLEVVKAATDGQTDAAKDNAAAIAALKTQQRELLAEYLKTKGPLDEYEKQHNALAAQIAALTKVSGAAAVSVTNLQEAQDALSTAKTVAEFKALQGAFFAAYQRGELTYAQFEQLHNAASTSMSKVGAAAGQAAASVGNLDDALGDLAKVQAAISSAKTDVDINKINAALRKLYDNGTITAEQYNAEIQKSADRQKELKAAVSDGAKAQSEKNKADKEALVTSEQLRRESGKRMEAERKAGDQAMQDWRKGSEEAKQDMTAMGDFFGGVVSRAREPLAELSEAALAAYDKLSGISTADIKLDTSSLEATTLSLERATDALDAMKAASNGVGMSGFGTWQTQTLVRSQQLQVQYLAEKQALLGLLDGYEGGTLVGKAFVDQAGAARNSMKLLNDSDLRTLEGAIDAAKQQMEQLGQSTRSTLEGLQSELLQLKGTEAEIERARFESRRRDIQAQQAQARQAGDSDAARNLREALAMLDEVESATTAKRNQAEQQKRADEVKAAQPAPAAPAGPATVIRLESARGRSAEVSVRSDADKTNLLGILEDAGLRSI